MKRAVVLFSLVAFALLCCGALVFAQTPAIENELLVVNLVPKDISNPMLKAFAAWAMKKYNVNVKTRELTKTETGSRAQSLLWMAASSPERIGGGEYVDFNLFAFSQVLKWKGTPQADVIWGGEGMVFDNLAAEGLLEPLQVPNAMWDEIPAAIGKPTPLPLKDPKKLWVGTYFEPYGIIYHPKQLKRLGIEIKNWDDLLNPKLKGLVTQWPPDCLPPSHVTYEVILQTNGWEKGWEWLKKLAANTGYFQMRSEGVPDLVAKGEFSIGFAVPSSMAFAQVLHGYDVNFLYPKNAYVTIAPISLMKGALHLKAGQAFIEFTLSEEGQKLLSELGVFPITPKYKVKGLEGSNAEKAAAFTGGMRSFFETEISNTFNYKIASDKKRIEDVNSYFRKNIEGK
jgi:ABC-type Fe3+ transport system substrate-binding protein